MCAPDVCQQKYDIIKREVCLSLDWIWQILEILYRTQKAYFHKRYVTKHENDVLFLISRTLRFPWSNERLTSKLKLEWTDYEEEHFWFYALIQIDVGILSRVKSVESLEILYLWLVVILSLLKAVLTSRKGESTDIRLLWL